MDGCGTIGAVLPTTFVAIPADKLQYVSANIPPGEEYRETSYDYQQKRYVVAVTKKPLNSKDLSPCSRLDFGVGLHTVTRHNTIAIRTLVGPPWYPLIVPPNELISLVSGGSRLCPAGLDRHPVLQYPARVQTTVKYRPDTIRHAFALRDPPFTLTPAQRLVPPVSSEDPIERETLPSITPKESWSATTSASVYTPSSCGAGWPLANIRGSLDIVDCNASIPAR